MPEKKPDRRVRRTRAMLRQALTELLETKDIRSITVQELTDLADLNRGTFYAHYRDVYDMLEKMEEEMFEEIAHLLDDCDPELLRGDLTPVLADVFRFVEKNRDLLPIFLEKEATGHFMIGLNQLICDKCLSRWTGVFDMGDDASYHYCLEFVVSGMVGVVREWIENGFREPPEVMAMMTARLIQSGLAWSGGTVQPVLLETKERAI